MVYPVDVDPLGHAGRGRLQRIGGRVDVHLAVEHGRREALGVEADFVGLAAVDLEAVNQEVVVERLAHRGEGAGEADVEQRDEVVVEVDVALQLAGELGDGEAVLDARDAAAPNHLAAECALAAVVVVGHRLRYHGRQVGLPGEGRGVDVVEDEAEVLLHAPVPEVRLDVGQVELHFGVGGAAVTLILSGIVA